MRIAIAAWHLKNFNVGLGRYCRELIEAIGRADQGNHYEVLMPGESCPLPAWPRMRYRTIRFPIFKRRLWEQLAPWLAGPYDLLHFPYDSCVAWKRSKFVVTVHDVKPMIFPGLASRPSISGLVERALVGDRWKRMDHVLTDSEHSRQDLIRYVGFPPERMTVAPPGVDLQRFHPIPDSDANCNERPYVLCVASADPTKNVEALVESFGKLSLEIRRSHDMVLVGDVQKRRSLRELVGRIGLERQTRFEGLVNDAQLIELYQRAALFVFPSLYEGFGLPVLEAMACGCPVICSNASSLPEVAGDAAILVSPTDIMGLTGEMERVLTSRSLRRTLREKGLTQAARFSWERTARETIAVYQQVVESTGIGC